MKRTGGWGRKKPLTAKTPMPRTGLARRGALVRSAEKTRAAAAKPRKPLVSRPKPVTPEERRARKLVALRSEGRCEGCLDEPATDYAHRVGRAQLGPFCPANALHLGRACHGWSHANPAKARDLGWILRSTDDYLTHPVQLPAHGLVQLGPDGSITPAEKRDAA